MLPPPRRFETAARYDAITGGPNWSGDLLLSHYLGAKAASSGMKCSATPMPPTSGSPPSPSAVSSTATTR